jgi:hypothetical protein
MFVHYLIKCISVNFLPSTRDANHFPINFLQVTPIIFSASICFIGDLVSDKLSSSPSYRGLLSTKDDDDEDDDDDTFGA